MSAFQNEYEVKAAAIKLHTSVKDTPPRGGAAMIEVNGNVLMFGGADREQTHYQDLVVYKTNSKSTCFEKVTCEGDVPTPRSGHAMVSYGKYALLFGGIDFAEEVAYNDLYMLDTESWEWSYVGEAGVEVIGRNSHSISILQTLPMEGETPQHVLVLYGGASPEHGPLGDTIYALLPPAHEIDPKTIYVEWKQLPTTCTAPKAREMHSTTSTATTMVITGGRTESGDVLTDIWCLQIHSSPSSSGSSSSSSSSSTNNSGNSLVQPVWTLITNISLPVPCCAHSAVFVQPTTASSSSSSSSALIQHTDEEAEYRLMIYGGFTSTGISSDILCFPWPLIRQSLTTSTTTATTSTTSAEHMQRSWQTISVCSMSNTTLQGRFGQVMMNVSMSLIHHLVVNTRYAPLFLRGGDDGAAAQVSLQRLRDYTVEDTATAQPVVSSMVMLFGGVTIEQDYADIWLLAIY